MKKFTFIFIIIFLFSCNVKQKRFISIEDRLQNAITTIYSQNPETIGIMVHLEAPDRNISWSGAVG